MFGTKRRGVAKLHVSVSLCLLTNGVVALTAVMCTILFAETFQVRFRGVGTEAEDESLRSATRNDKVSEQADLLEDHVVLLTYGKVASSSLGISFASVLGLEFKQDVGLKGYHTQVPSYDRGITTHAPYVVKDFLAKVPRGKRCWVVTVVRNPFVHPISVYGEQRLSQVGQEFYNNSAYLFDDFRAWRKKSNQHEVWFGQTFFENLRINVVAHARGFDFESRHLLVRAVVAGVDVRVLVIRYEDYNEWDNIIGRYFKGFKLGVTYKGANHRITDQRLWAVPAKLLRSQYKYSAEEAQDVLQSDSWLFYTRDEKMAMLRNATD